MVARASTSLASSAVSAVTLTSVLPFFQRMTRIVQPGPAARMPSEPESFAVRKIVASGGSKVASGRTSPRLVAHECGWVPAVNGASAKASMRSNGVSESSTCIT